MKLSEICDGIYKVESTEDLRTINQAIGMRWRELQSRTAALAKVRFSIGDKVCWTGKRGHQVGTILRFGPKNVIVRTETGVEWRVSPTLLAHEGQAAVAGNAVERG